ncbi:hypothetical protein MTYP_01040 [Methylophilaceae bacterium]|nr:hypothetical protein MTYP_01040 [Methylophilaceae bacterium]
MATEGSWAEVNVKLDGFSRIDFDKKKIRAAMVVIGRSVTQEAKSLVSPRGRSRPGEMPGRQTGALRRSIKYVISRPGFLVRVAPYKTDKMGKDFYPAFLHYGSTKNNLQPRENYMTDALEKRAEATRNVLRRALEDALVPRK